MNDLNQDVAEVLALDEKRTPGDWMPQVHRLWMRFHVGLIAFMLTMGPMIPNVPAKYLTRKTTRSVDCD